MGWLVLSALVAIVLTVLLEERVSYWFARVLGGIVPKGHRRITGLWYSVFWFQGVDGATRRKAHIMIFRTFWKRTVARTVAGAGHPFRFWAENSSDMYLTGRWEHIKKHNIYHGAIHFIVDPEGETMHGGWLGFNKHQVVGSGRWTLVQIGSDTNKKAVREAIAKYTQPKGGGIFDAAAEASIKEVFLRSDGSGAWQAAQVDNSAPNSPEA